MIEIIGVIKILGLFGTEADAAVALHALAGPELFEKGMSFLKANLHNIQAGQGFNSIGKLEISEVALEEILQNALVPVSYTHLSPKSAVTQILRQFISLLP